MTNYQKPVAMAADGIAEGVFAASGTSNGIAGVSSTEQAVIVSGFSYDAWDGGANVYFTVTNNTSQRAEQIQVSFKYAGGTIKEVPFGATGSAENGVLKLTVNNWGNGFEAGASFKCYAQLSTEGTITLSE